MNKETNAETMHNSQHDGKPMLPAVRPSSASEALKLIKAGKLIEVPNEQAMDFLRYVDKAERRISFNCCFNGYNVGWCVICP